jgi:hypothetical protein
MRIVITKNGRILIQEINPDVKYKSMLTNSKSLNKTKFFPKNIQFNKLKKKAYGNSVKNIFSPQNKPKNLKIDEVLSDFNSPKSKSKSLCKILNIDPNKRLNMPQSISERYFSTQVNSMNLDNEEKNILPDVLISINKSIEKDASKMGLDYVYNNISSLQTMKEKGEDKMLFTNSEQDGMGRYTTSFNLPKVLPAYPLKYIISPNSVRNLKKQAIKLENDLYKDKRLTEDNFRSKVKKDIKRTLALNLKNEIKSENTNLITYLNEDKDIKTRFVDRLSKFDDNRLRRLNKISQKTMFIKEQEKIIKERIKDKIIAQFRNTSEKYKEGLENIKDKLIISEKIIISEEKKVIDKKERYVNQYNEAELNWVKSGALRFYNKSKPPVNSATALVIDK